MARRRRGRGRRAVAGFQPRKAAWTISASGADSTGTQQATVNFGGAAQTLAAGVNVTFQPVILPISVTANNAPPSIEEVDIVGLDCHIDITSVSAAGLYLVGAALYVSEFNTSANKWSVRSPTVNTDAGREDNLHIQCAAVQVPLAAADADPVSLQLRLMLPFPIRIGQGQALHVTLGNDTTSAGIISFVPFIRARITNPE